MRLYKTHEVAEIIGIHENTVRLYEKNHLISKVERLENGYRIFTDLHIEQLRMARAVFKVEVMQNGLRKQAVDIIKTCAKGKTFEARQMAQSYLEQIDKEIEGAREAINITDSLLNGSKTSNAQTEYTRKQAAQLLNSTVDTLRNWELNGLLVVRRAKNGYRIYNEEDIMRLKIIRSLRCANYSLISILRMLKEVSDNPQADIEKVIDTPNENEDVISVCDKLISSLINARENMKYAISQIDKIKRIMQQKKE